MNTTIDSLVDPVDQKAIATARMLAADAVQHFGKGHCGTAIALSPVAYWLYQRVLRHDPRNPRWPGRDRFVLSCGHAAIMQYVQLHLAGYDVTMEDLRSYRKHNSRTPSHPEYRLTPGVEITTGPLGQGLAMATGMAMASRIEHALFDPAASYGESIFDYAIYVIASDGDIQEGATAEAGSLAGRLGLGNLIVLYDDNNIMSDGAARTTMSEDVALRYEAYGWHIERVALQADGDVDLAALAAAIERARQESDRPSFISFQSQIAWPAPHARNTAAAHGAPIGEAEIRATKALLGMDPDAHFVVPEDVLERTRRAVDRGAVLRREWQVREHEWRTGNPEGYALLRRIEAAGPIDLSGWTRQPHPEPVQLRQVLKATLEDLAALMPELWGGSADLGTSNGIPNYSGDRFGNPAGGAEFGWSGRNINYGVRELAMAATENGLALSGRVRPFGATFLIFSDFMRPAIRLAAMMELPTIYFWTHDSIGLGEDGATHQPVEQLAGLRAVPGLDIVRPADPAEFYATLEHVLKNPGGPVGFSLARQELADLPRDTNQGYGPASEAVRGGYILRRPNAEPTALLLASGSEVGIALEAADILQASGIHTQVVSLPCFEWFDAQDEEYRDQVLPPRCRVRVAIEAASPDSWHRYVGLDGAIVGLSTFGSSSSGATLYRERGVTADRTAQLVRQLLA